MSKESKVNIKKISKDTGFSAATVSNALNNKRGVNKLTSEKIIKVAESLGYINISEISKIKFVVYKKNGLIVDDSPYFSMLLEGVEKECRNIGYEMVVCNLDHSALDYIEQVQWILNDTSSAIILLGTELLEEDIEPYKNSKCPLVCLDFFNSDMDFNTVLINNTDAAQNATEYLIKKGHREIGYLKGSFRIKPFQSREIGYERALLEGKVPKKEKYIITLTPTMEGSYNEMINYLCKNSDLPTAFFADNDMVALGAMKAFQEKGYRIPEDISIVGFDDLPFGEIATPRLTTIRVSKQEIGELAVKRIYEMVIQKKESKLKICICTEFIERESVKQCNS